MVIINQNKILQKCHANLLSQSFRCANDADTSQSDATKFASLKLSRIKCVIYVEGVFICKHNFTKKTRETLAYKLLLTIFVISNTFTLQHSISIYSGHYL